MNVTFDTNVYVSGFTRPEGPAAQALANIVAGRDTLFTSREIVNELIRVLRDKFNWDDTGLEAVRDWMTRYPRPVSPTETLNILTDEPDNRILECALAVDSDVIVTGDRAMLELGSIGRIRIIRLATYLDVDNLLTNG